MTRWKPDTCGCVITVNDWDSSPPDMTPVTKCAVHAAVDDADIASAVYLGENQLKNRVESEMLQTLSAHTDTDKQGNPIWKEGVAYDWKFDVNRKLEIGVKGVTLSGQEKTDLSDALVAHPDVDDTKVVIK